MQLAYLNAAFETGIENPLDAAIVEAGERAGLTTDGYAKVDEIPYDFIRKRLTIVVAPAADPATHLIITKGAFANVLADLHDGGARCRPTSRWTTRPAQRWTPSSGRRAKRDFACWRWPSKRVAPRERYAHEDEVDMTFRGLPAVPGSAEGDRRPEPSAIWPRSASASRS